MAFLAENQDSIDRKYEVQKMRADILDFAITNSINKNHVLNNSQIIPLLQDLPEVQLEMINMNLERISSKIATSEDIQQLLYKMEATAQIHMRLRQLGKALGEAQDRDDPEFAKRFF